MAKLDLPSVPVRTGARYPAPYDLPCRDRQVQRLGDAGGLTRLGVSRVRLPPGSWSSQRHWHTEVDEFLYVVEGELVLVTDAGEELVRAGDCAAFPAGSRSGHHLQNRSNRDAVILAMSSQSPADRAEYPDIDLVLVPGPTPGAHGYTHKDGTTYAAGPDPAGPRR